jgi:hypothetical protein
MLFSCFEDKRTQNVVTVPPVEQTDTVKKENSKSDTLKTDSTRIIAEDTVKADAVTPAITVAKEDGLPSLWEVLALGVSGFLLFFCLFILHRIRRLANDVSHELRETERKSSNSLYSYNTKIGEKIDKIKESSSNMRNDIDLLSERIRRLESIGMPTSRNTKEKGEKTEVPKGGEKQVRKKGYFGMVKGGGGIAMFNDYPKSRNEGAYFDVDYLDDAHCEFAPIDLDRIRSIDAVSEAVEYNGDMAYAKSMKVQKKGEAVFDKEHYFWRITEKANIELKN